jgi:hypothetical protein
MKLVSSPLWLVVKSRQGGWWHCFSRYLPFGNFPRTPYEILKYNIYASFRVLNS